METLVNLKQQLPIPIKDERQNSQSVPLPGPKKSYFSPRAMQRAPSKAPWIMGVS